MMRLKVKGSMHGPASLQAKKRGLIVRRDLIKANRRPSGCMMALAADSQRSHHRSGFAASLEVCESPHVCANRRTHNAIGR
jgi:hypothetical protein